MSSDTEKDKEKCILTNMGYFQLPKDIIVWPLSPYISSRQIEEWRHDANNVDINSRPLEERVAFLKEKAETRGFFHYGEYLNRLRISLCGRVLEIGAGNFWLSSYVSSFENVEGVFGVELSLDRILAFRDISIELFRGCREKITYIVGDMHRLEIPDGSFDFVICDATLHHADNLIHVLRECRRVLKPGGRFVAFREPFIPRTRLKSPVFNDRFPENGSAMYYYLDGWKSAFINGRYVDIRFIPFYENTTVKGIPLSRSVQRWASFLLLPLWLVRYPKVVMAAKKPEKNSL